MIPASLLPLANHLWQSTLFVVAVALVNLTLRKNWAAVRHRLWLAASVKFLIPFSLLVGIGSHFQWRTVSATPPPSVSIVIEEVSKPFSSPTVSAPITPLPERQPDRVPAILLAIWLCGILGSVLWWSQQWRKLDGAKRKATFLNLDFPLPVASCSGRIEPGVFGILRPVLLLPDGLADQLTPTQMQAVLAHELCHVRRRDNLTASIHMLVEALFWFYPLAWWIKARLVEEQERACDEEVLMLGGDPKIYAESILKICAFYVAGPLICMSGITGADLKKRITEIMRASEVADLTFARKCLLTSVVVGMVSVPILLGSIHERTVLQGESNAPIAFEVVSVKPSLDTNRSIQILPGGRVKISGPVRAFIGWAYHLPSYQLLGGPDWINSGNYLIEAIMPAGSPAYTLGQFINGDAPKLQRMLQTLLADKFKLIVNHETRDLPLYNLTVLKGGATLQQPQEGSCIALDPNGPPSPLPPPPAPGKPIIGHCGVVMTVMRPSEARMDGGKVSANEFIRALSSVLGRPVVDNTGLSGTFDVHLAYASDDALPPAPGDPPRTLGSTMEPGPATIFTAIQEQLGLKLESAKGPVEVLVIVSAEKPTENDTTNVSETPSFEDSTSLKTAPAISQPAGVKGILTLVTTKQTQAVAQAVALPTFEVVSIKPTKSTGGKKGGWCHGIDSNYGPSIAADLPALGRCSYVRASLKGLIANAYYQSGAPNPAMVGGEPWMDSEEFDVEAKAEDPAHTTEEQLQSMLQAMLRERFKLQMHFETTEESGFALVRVPNGPALKEYVSDGTRPPSGITSMPIGQEWLWKGRAMNGALIAQMVGRNLGHPVADKTGLPGLYDFDLTWSPNLDERAGRALAASSDSAPGPSFVTALREQLGLRLEPAKVPVQRLVIDHAEKPAED